MSYNYHIGLWNEGFEPALAVSDGTTNSVVVDRERLRQAGFAFDNDTITRWIISLYFKLTITNPLGGNMTVQVYDTTNAAVVWTGPGAGTAVVAPIGTVHYRVLTSVFSGVLAAATPGGDVQWHLRVSASGADAELICAGFDLARSP